MNICKRFHSTLPLAQVAEAALADEHVRGGERLDLQRPHPAPEQAPAALENASLGSVDAARPPRGVQREPPPQPLPEAGTLLFFCLAH